MLCLGQVKIKGSRRLHSLATDEAVEEVCSAFLGAVDREQDMALMSPTSIGNRLHVRSR